MLLRYATLAVNGLICCKLVTFMDLENCIAKWVALLEFGDRVILHLGQMIGSCEGPGDPTEMSNCKRQERVVAQYLVSEATRQGVRPSMRTL